jgi:S-methylmethionine-dependent homocysteine/selenocysteine methylase
MRDRGRLPQLDDDLFLTDGGMETWLVFLAGFDLPDGFVSYFMVNCAHPTHFEHVLEGSGEWRDRIRGIRANASAKSHAELDESDDLDAGDPNALASHYPALRARRPKLQVVGGCCGTDHRHIAAIYDALSA